MKKKLLLMMSILSGVNVIAQSPGDLYSSFGTDGVSYENWTDSISRGYDIGIQSDGHIIIPGQLQSSSGYDLLVTRLDNQGKSGSFGNSSRGFIYGFTDIEFATSVKILPDEKILIAGYWEQLAPQAFVIRLLANGEIDEEFADNGILDLGDHWLKVNDMDVYGDETTYKIILAGQSDSDIPTLAMVNQDGSLVTAFRGGIISGLDPGEITDVAVDNGAGEIYISVDYNGPITELIKFDATDGSLVTDFGVDGILSSESLPVELTFNAIVLDTENDVLAAFGQYQHTAGDLDMCALWVNSTDGSINTDYGVNGWAWLRSAGTDEYLTAAVQQSDGKYYIGGYSNFSGDNDFLVGRLNADGLGDPEFGTAGLLLLPLELDQHLSALALSPEEDILYATGFSYATDEASLTVAAFHTTEIATGVTTLPDEKINVYQKLVENQISIVANKPGSYKLTLSDLSGKILIQQSWSNQVYDLSIQNLAPSVYILNIEKSGKRILTAKILKP